MRISSRQGGEGVLSFDLQTFSCSSLCFVLLLLIVVLSSRMDISKSKDGYVQNSVTPKGEQSSDDVQMDDFTATVAGKWQGTVADKQNMVMLGRTQVLRVRNCTHLVLLPSMAHNSGVAKLQLHLDPRFLRRPYLYLGAYFRVGIHSSPHPPNRF